MNKCIVRDCNQMAENNINCMGDNIFPVCPIHYDGVRKLTENATDEIRNVMRQMWSDIRDIREGKRAKTDKERIDWLEKMANVKGGILLHDGSESGRIGLGLRPGTLVRTLRKAIDYAMEKGDDAI